MRLAASIDDIAVRQQDTNLNGTFDDTWYHLTDTLFSTVAILDDAANLVERVSYDAYGNARHHHPGDLTGDGAVTSDDGDALAALESYGVGDITRTGVVNTADQAIVSIPRSAQAAGRISTGSGGTDNIIGYAGYVFNAEIHGSGLFTVRHRHYSPELGRWFTRDPIGYVDGMSLYEYVQGQPLFMLDPLGLIGRRHIAPLRMDPPSLSPDITPQLTNPQNLDGKCKKLLEKIRNLRRRLGRSEFPTCAIILTINSSAPHPRKKIRFRGITICFEMLRIDCAKELRNTIGSARIGRGIHTLIQSLSQSRFHCRFLSKMRPQITSHGRYCQICRQPFCQYHRHQFRHQCKRQQNRVHCIAGLYQASHGR